MRRLGLPQGHVKPLIESHFLALAAVVTTFYTYLEPTPVRPCFSTAVLEEYAEVLARPRFGFPPDEIAAVVAMLRNGGELVVPRGSAPVLPDPSDAKFLHCAETAQAEYLVTGNKRHFPQETCGAVRVVNAGESLDPITLEI
jgi:predicted nucleic acid-binding protein